MEQLTLNILLWVFFKLGWKPIIKFMPLKKKKFIDLVFGWRILNMSKNTTLNSARDLSHMILKWMHLLIWPLNNLRANILCLMLSLKILSNVLENNHQQLLKKQLTGHKKVIFLLFRSCYTHKKSRSMWIMLGILNNRFCWRSLLFE